MRAFSSGAVALTGVEAISNGVPAFKKPESRNAATHARLDGRRSSAAASSSVCRCWPTGCIRPSSRARDAAVDHRASRCSATASVLYFVLQFSTFAHLDPGRQHRVRRLPPAVVDHRRRRLSAASVRDGGDRLVFSNGIIMLAACGRSLLVVAFGGQDQRADPAVRRRGVHRVHAVAGGHGACTTGACASRGGSRGLAVNGVGGVATFVVLVDVVVSKFTIGAWIPVLLVPLMVLGFLTIKRHYDRLDTELRIPDGWRAAPVHHVAVLVVHRVNRGTAEALAYTQALGAERVEAVAVALEDGDREALTAAWAAADLGAPLTVLDSPYRHFFEPFVEHLRTITADGTTATVVLPDFSVDHAWQEPLHNQGTVLLADALRDVGNTVIVLFPFGAES